MYNKDVADHNSTLLAYNVSRHVNEIARRLKEIDDFLEDATTRVSTALSLVESLTEDLAKVMIKSNGEEI